MGNAWDGGEFDVVGANALSGGSPRLVRGRCADVLDQWHRRELARELAVAVPKVRRGAAVDQELHHAGVVVCGGPVEACLPCLIHRVDIGAALKQRLQTQEVRVR